MYKVIIRYMDEKSNVYNEHIITGIGTQEDAAMVVVNLTDTAWDGDIVVNIVKQDI